MSSYNEPPCPRAEQLRKYYASKWPAFAEDKALSDYISKAMAEFAEKLLREVDKRLQKQGMV